MSTSNFSNAFRSLFENKLKNRVLFNEPLAPLLAYRVGGPADILVFPENEAELLWISDTAKKNAIPLTIIGNGTNLLVRDEGIRGITISLAKAFQDISYVNNPQKSPIWIRCGGGVLKESLLKWTISQGLKGLEFSAGVPGTIGGGIYMNAGTKYGCYGDMLKELRVFDFQHGVKQLSRESLHFGYREQNAVKKSLVISAVFELFPGDKKEIQEEVDRIVLERAEKQPLDFPSCGSTFKNPPDQSAGRLIERAGLKGTRVGGAEISEKHANFILNKGNAKAQDIIALIELVKEKVMEQFGVQLETEVVILGDVKK